MLSISQCSSPRLGNYALSEAAIFNFYAFSVPDENLKKPKDSSDSSTSSPLTSGVSVPKPTNPNTTKDNNGGSGDHLLNNVSKKREFSFGHTSDHQSDQSKKMRVESAVTAAPSNGGVKKEDPKRPAFSQQPDKPRHNDGVTISPVKSKDLHTTSSGSAGSKTSGSTTSSSMSSTGSSSGSSGPTGSGPSSGNNLGSVTITKLSTGSSLNVPSKDLNKILVSNSSAGGASGAAGNSGPSSSASGNSGASSGNTPNKVPSDKCSDNIMNSSAVSGGNNKKSENPSSKSPASEMKGKPSFSLKQAAQAQQDKLKCKLIRGAKDELHIEGRPKLSIVKVPRPDAGPGSGPGGGPPPAAAPPSSQPPAISILPEGKQHSQPPPTGGYGGLGGKGKPLIANTAQQPTPPVVPKLKLPLTAGSPDPKKKSSAPVPPVMNSSKKSSDSESSFNSSSLGATMKGPAFQTAAKPPFTGGKPLMKQLPSDNPASNPSDGGACEKSKSVSSEQALQPKLKIKLSQPAGSPSGVGESDKPSDGGRSSKEGDGDSYQVWPLTQFYSVSFL